VQASLSQIRLLALDIDGTLVDGREPVSERNRRSIELAQQAGLCVVIATGRRYRRARDVVAQLETATPTIALGGSLAKEANESLLFAHAFREAEVLQIVDSLRDHGQTAVAQLDSHPRGGPDFLLDTATDWNAATQRYSEHNEAHCEQRDLRAAAEEATQVLVVGSFGEQEAFHEVRKTLELAQPGQFRCHIVPDGRGGGGHYLEVVPTRVSKWSAVLQLAEGRGIAANEIAAIGDEANDRPMIEGAAIGVAMGNANPDLKLVADTVTSDVAEDGVADWIQGWLERPTGRS